MNTSLLFLTIALFGGGLLILFSASMVLSYKNFGSIWSYALRQFLIGGIIGAVLCTVGALVPYRQWKRLAIPLMLTSFFLLALLFIPHTSYSFGGARRWLKLGPVSFQPSEFLKFSFIVYLASWLDARRRQVASISQGMIPFALMITVVAVFLIMQPDVGTLGIILATAGMMYLVGGGKISQIAALAGLGLVLFYFIIQLAPYRLSRVLVFFKPDLDPQGAGYQISQASIAIGTGGFWGAGFGRGVQKYHYLPEPMGDSIFAIFVEEMGFLGALILTGAFAAFFIKGFAIARNAPDTFGRLLASGISVGIMTQAFVNMAAISGLLPLTGIPLPFLSYGGTALGMTLGMVGILLNISKRYT